MSFVKKCRTLWPVLIVTAFSVNSLFADPGTPNLTLSSGLDWETGIVSAATALELASAGLRFPGGRTSAEEILKESYLGLIRPVILSLQVDSSSTVQDVILSGGFTLAELDRVCLAAKSVPPVFSADFTRFGGIYTLSLGLLSAALVRHTSATEPDRPLMPVPAANYTGIIIIADNPLPIHGRNSASSLVPCLFPKIWDSEMNLIYDRNRASPAIFSAGRETIVHYTGPAGIFAPTPSGLDEKLTGIVGERPLRVFARKVYGILPTDAVIDRADAELILSTETNRRLLAEGRVVFVISEEALTAGQ